MNLSAQDAVKILNERNLKISFAESCTGGMAAASIVSVSGSSKVFDMSVVTYSDAAKVEYTDVTEEVLYEYGAVSEQTSALMATGIKRRSKADIGVGITGIAGPGGGTVQKPVGTVYVSIAFQDGVTSKLYNFKGDRQSVREQTVTAALNLIKTVIKF